MAAVPQSRNPKIFQRSGRPRPIVAVVNTCWMSACVLTKRHGSGSADYYQLFSKLLLAFGLAAGIYFGVMKVVTSMWLKNPEYNVTDLNVETDGVLDADDRAASRRSPQRRKYLSCSI